MSTHFFKSFFRRLKSNRGHFIVLSIALILGLTSFATIVIYVSDIFHYDDFPMASRIFRVSLSIESDGLRGDIAYSDVNLGQRLKELAPEVEETVGLGVLHGSQSVQINGKSFAQDGFIIAEPTYFSVFKHEWLAGDQQTALTQPHAMVLTKSLADNFFPGRDALNEQIIFNQQNYIVKGIIADLPRNVHLPFRGIVSTATPFIGYESGFEDFCYTYVLIRDGASSQQIPAKLDEIYNEYMREALEQLNSKGSYDLERMRDIHFGDTKLFDFPKYNKANLLLFLSIGIAILFLSGLNFINISLAHNLTRFKEVGMKKILGLTRVHIFHQLFIECLCISVVSLSVAFGLFHLLSPEINESLNTSLSLQTEDAGNVMFYMAIYCILLSIITSILSVSKLMPNTGTTASLVQYSRKREALKRVLMILQFTASSILLIGSLVVKSQIDLIFDADQGFSTQRTMLFDIPNEFDESKVAYFCDQVNHLPFVQKASYADKNSVPAADVNVEIFELPIVSGHTTKLVQNISVGPDYLSLFSIKIIQGKSFSPEDIDHGNLAIVNEAFVKSYGWQDPLDKTFNFKFRYPEKQYRVIGVVSDFYLQGINKRVDPLIITMAPHAPLKAIIKLDANITRQNLALIDDVAKKVFNVVPARAWVDDLLAERIKNENILYRLLIVFSFALVAISSLSLYGSTALSLIQNTKEYAVRKIVGASAISLFLLICKKELKLISLGVMLSAPISYFVMSYWLSYFPRQTAITPLHLIVPVLLIISTSILAISYHAIKGALNNPVNVLKQ